MTDVVVTEAGGPLVVHLLSFAVSKVGRGKAVYMSLAGDEGPHVSMTGESRGCSRKRERETHWDISL